MPAFNISGNTA